MKICFVAPTDPSKGAVGIVKYVSELTKELNKIHDVVFISFKKLYPFIDFHKQASPIRGEIYRILSTYSPPTWFRARTIINDVEPDIIQFHWWTSILNPVYITLLKMFKEYKTVVMCQNPVSHEQSLLFRSLDKLNKAMFTLADQIIVNTFEAEAVITKMYPKLKNKLTVIPHGNLIFHNGTDPVSNSEAKAKLGLDLDRPCLLFFGFVRKYKGLSYLLRAIQGVNCSLIIAGKFIEPLDNYIKLIEGVGIKDQVKVFPYLIPDDMIPLLFKAADMVVLPYISFSSASGIAHIAMGFGKCILATQCPGFNEMFRHNVNAYLVPPRNSDLLRKAIIELVHSPMQMREMGRNVNKLAESYEWSKIADMHTALYRHLLGGNECRHTRR